MLVITFSLIAGTVCAETWEYEELYNPVDRATAYFAAVGTDFGSITVRCSARDRKAQIRIALPRDLIADMDGLQWLFDNAKATSASWDRSPNGRDLIIPSSRSERFATLLRAYNTLHLDIEREGEDAVSFEFPLQGSSKAISSLATHCRI